MANNDPRLVELQFLSELEAKRYVDFHMHQDTTAWKRFADTFDDFRDLVAHLVLEDYVNGTAEITFKARDGESLEQILAEQRKRTFNAIIDRQRVWLRPNHKGRLRLWALRDELLSHRRLDRFGIMNDGESWRRDLQVAWSFLPAEQPMSLLFSDLDHCKAVNDQLGHLVGDAVIRKYLQTVRDFIEKRGSAYRVGGDEVFVFLPNTDQDSVQKLAESIRTEIESMFFKMPEVSSLSSKPTASIGVVTLKDRIDPERAYALVDKAVYEAKKAGRNCVRAG